MRWGNQIRAVLAVTAAAAGLPAVADDPAAASPTAAPASDPPAERSFADVLDPKPTIKLRGRIEVDAIWPSQSMASRAQIGTLEGGYGFRRARLGAEGTIDSSSAWVAEFDFAGGNIKFRDVFVGLTAVPGLREVKVGHVREPFSLEGATSSRFITFLERSPLNQFDPTRNWGVAGFWLADDERLFAALGGFVNGTDNNTGAAPGNANDWAVTGRVTGLPVYDANDDAFRLIHVGGAVSFRQPVNGVVQYIPAPQSSLLTVSDDPVTPLLPPIVIPANGQQLYNLQAAAVYGPVSLQAEWFGNVIQQTGGGTVFFHGAYVYGSLFLTGEHRGYDAARAGFGEVAVRRPVTRSSDGTVTGCGAVELAARFSITNTASPNLPPTQSGSVFATDNGSILYESTWGVNWYLNDYTRIMANYELAIPTVRGSPSLPVHIFGIRTAIWW
jgi:phosphate-selective porin OprO/OprP